MTDGGIPRDEFAPGGGTAADDASGGQDDETLREVVRALRPLPVVTEADVRRIVSRAAAGGRPGRRAAGRWFTALPLAAAAALVVAAGIGGFLVRDLTLRQGPASRTPATPAASALPEPNPMITGVAADAGAEAPIPTQFVLDAPRAARVALVGAFNDWDSQAAPLVHDRATGLWTITVPLTPGRHVYGFMVNDSVITLDPRAPSTRDPELGTTGSVILVGTP